MKKLFVLSCIAGAIFALSSCKTSQNRASATADINGEWNITEVNGHSIKTAEGEPRAYMSLDTKGKQMNGCAGCNRIFGRFDIDTAKKTIGFGDVASTRMMCADMTTEDLVMGTFGKLASYETVGDNTLILKSADGKSYIKMVREKK